MTPAHRITGTDRAICVTHRKQVRLGESCPLCPRVGALPPRVGPPESRGKRSHYSAVRTTCARGHSHPSKTEARACAVVHDRFPDACVFRNARLPLWCLTPTDKGIPHYVNIDFVVVAEGGDPVAFIDAKCGKRSRDWERGRAAAQATYGIPVEELEA